METIEILEDQELSSVNFGQDYLQLEFSGAKLTLFLLPEVFVSEASSLAEGSYGFGEPGYRDALCSQIGESVKVAKLEPGIALEIEFETGTIFRRSLRDEDYEGPEAGHFSTGIAGDPLMVF